TRPPARSAHAKVFAASICTTSSHVLAMQLPPVPHAVVQVPHALAELERSASQPSSARPSQSPKPARQLPTVHAPLTHAPIALVTTHAASAPSSIAASQSWSRP